MHLLKQPVTPELIAHFKDLTTRMYSGETTLDEKNRLMQERELLMEQYDFMDHRFTENGLVGVRRADGTIAIPAVNDDVKELYRLDLHPMSYIVIKDGKMGLMDATGSGYMGTPYIYDDITIDMPSYLHIGHKDGKMGILFPLGDELTPCELTEVFAMSDGIMPLKIDDQWGFFSMDDLYVRPEYDEIEPIFSGSGPVCVRKGYIWGYIECESHRFIPKDEADNGDFALIRARE